MLLGYKRYMDYLRWQERKKAVLKEVIADDMPAVDPRMPQGGYGMTPAGYGPPGLPPPPIREHRTQLTQAADHGRPWDGDTVPLHEVILQADEATLPVDETRVFLKIVENLLRCESSPSS